MILLDNLDIYGVEIVTINEQDNTRHRQGLSNSEQDRLRIQEFLGNEYDKIQEIISVWGNSPIIQEEIQEPSQEYTFQPTETQTLGQYVTDLELRLLAKGLI